MVDVPSHQISKAWKVSIMAYAFVIIAYFHNAFFLMKWLTPLKQ
jgi:hypothetical protein